MFCILRQSTLVTIGLLTCLPTLARAEETQDEKQAVAAGVYRSTGGRARRPRPADCSARSSAVQLRRFRPDHRRRRNLGLERRRAAAGDGEMLAEPQRHADLCVLADVRSACRGPGPARRKSGSPRRRSRAGETGRRRRSRSQGLGAACATQRAGPPFHGPRILESGECPVRIAAA